LLFITEQRIFSYTEPNKHLSQRSLMQIYHSAEYSKENVSVSPNFHGKDRGHMKNML